MPLFPRRHRFRHVVALAPALALLLAVVRAEADTIPPGLHPGDVYERIFVTSMDYTVVTGTIVPPDAGSFGGLAAADYQVTLSAYQAGLIPNWNGTDLLYHAILSTSTVNARDRLNIQGPLYNMQNQLIATSSADLWSGSIHNAVRYDEFGNSAPDGTLVWTGTAGLGTVSTNTAGNWTDPNAQGDLGNPFFATVSWINQTVQNANLTAHLYGVSGPITVVPEPSSTLLAALGFAGLLAWRWRATSAFIATCDCIRRCATARQPKFTSRRRATDNQLGGPNFWLRQATQGDHRAT